MLEIQAVIIAIISGLFSLAGILISARITQNKIMTEIKINQAVTDTKIEELTRETRLHNGFGQRIPVIEEQIKVINHRINEINDRSNA